MSTDAITIPFETDDAAVRRLCVERDYLLSRIDHLLAALQAIVEAGRMSDQPRAVYCADIARAALTKE